ncbi:MAG TPA: carboxypeptidase regulatory-like domain-containing protein [Vicinamibacteria bacterium]|nr:carboxypeptidase regulatory-like domain-containing protein [Vicinamibacteria bacterium]
MSVLAVLLALVASAQTSPSPPPAAPEKGTASMPAQGSRKTPPPVVTSLDVTVIDRADKPVEGAFVFVIPVSGAFRSGGVAAEKVRSGFTSRDGTVKISPLPPGPWNAWVHARGLATQRVRRVASGPLRVVLEKGGAITGVVREGDGRPVPGARVRCGSDVPAPEGWPAEATRNEAVTDGEGLFRLEGIGRAPVRLSVTARGYARAERGDVRAGPKVELYVFPGATLSGAVRDDAGRAVKGAEVRAEGESGGYVLPAERTDERGAFVMAGIPPGDHTVVAREGARAPGIAAVVVRPGSEATVSLTVSDGGYVTGRIVDADGRPLAGRARVEVFEDRGLPSFASDALAGEARADGTFALGPLPLGTLGIGVSAPGHAPKRVEAGVPARGRTVDLGDVALDAGLAIRGRVRSREGGGIEGATVRAMGEEPGGASEAEGTSLAEGRFELGGLRAGRHHLSATAPGYAAAKVTAEAGGEPVDLVMDAAGGIAGRVADESGAAVEDAWVAAVERNQSGGPRVRSDEGDGRFLLQDIAPATYDISFQAAGRGEASKAGVKVVAGRTTDVGTVVLAPGGLVQGVVVDAEGQGIPGATVNADRGARRSDRLETQTGSAGAFEIRGVPPGPVSVRASHPAYAASAPVETLVDPAKEPPAVRIVLARGARIEGRALHRDGRPFAAGRVQASSRDVPFASGEWGEGALAGDGSFVLDHVPAGRVRLELLAFTPSSPMVVGGGSEIILTGVAAREWDVRDGETVSVDLPLRDVVVSGRVTRGGQPEAGVLVSVTPAEGGSVIWAGPAAPRPVGSAEPPPLNAITREDGTYELLVFAPGPAYVEMASRGQAFPDREVEIPDAERFSLDLEIASTTVAGVVVDKETGAPVDEVSLWLRPARGQEATGGGAQSGPDGRFSIAAEPGEYTLVARSRDRQPASLPLSVGPPGVADVRVELEAGLGIAGRLLDQAGSPASGFQVFPTGEDGERAGYAISGPDGRFLIGGLGSRPYALVGGSELAGFAFRRGVAPGDEPIVLAMQAPARIAVRVVDGAGRPVPAAYPRVETIDGVPVRLPGRVSGPTDAAGTFDLSSPAGRVEVVARGELGTGRGAVSVRPGETAPLTIVLPKDAPKAP